MAIVSCNLFYYIWLHLNFVREHEDDLMAHQRVQIMVSQIQPHFLYNTLSTIQALCHSDPEKAADTVEKFGTYLRQNIDSLNQTELIPFNKELEHTRVYVDIEQIRFPSISVRYDIDDVKDVDFDLPALTIQPMVENAIRHGVRSRKHGEIVVAAHKVDDNYVITIRDNGKGFDTSLLMNQDNSHIGIQNVKERIEDQCKGTFIIESTPGEGTLVTFRIPEM
jgi:sensor histidine kinase YesM